MAGQLTAKPTNGAVNLFVPETVSSGGLDVTAGTQLACTATHAKISDNCPATHVDIRIHENLTLSQTPWAVRCGPNGTLTPVTK
ncbi:hypothetical protein [Streptomyces sp. PTY087I2]|uniref:hypothetical protein n=1 Tax=Streptomyces sp. PTY087I2 TaxID=1819298 RepID=UPI00082902FE|nr:hypothetical protein [Streptomyces sp. PTY087I2]OCC08576.1 hypothetical protein A3Q37_05616 [Streptomyces sp. PTY087I2]